MSALVKSTLKLLIRMKGFWFFLLITPFLTTLILRTKENYISFYDSDAPEMITELDGAEEKVAYFNGKGKCVIKVYDASKDAFSEYMLNKIQQSGLFQVCRVYLPDYDDGKFDELIKERLEVDGSNDRMGAALCIRPGFTESLGKAESKDALAIYKLSEDSRTYILESEIKTILTKIESVLKAHFGDAAGTLDALEVIDSIIPGKKTVALSTADNNSLTLEQTNQKSRMGYALAILTLGYVFGGIFVAHICINEQKDRVFTRIKLAGMGMTEYFFSKILAVIFVTLMLTGIMAICTFFIDVESMGMSIPNFLLVISLMGLIFSTLSLMIGLLIGDVMSSNVAAFTLWSMSALLSGLYFPIDGTTEVIKTLSYIMPHKWFLDGTELILIGDKMGQIMILCVTVAYLIIIGSIGSMCLKVKRVDEWGSN
ncbi:MAG: ABC transporter permease [Lachnospiraceae bacterium]|nr:ABC transporter permease [Lachnospiraceae bacterium]